MPVLSTISVAATRSYAQCPARPARAVFGRAERLLRGRRIRHRHAAPHPHPRHRQDPGPARPHAGQGAWPARCLSVGLPARHHAGIAGLGLGRRACLRRPARTAVPRRRRDVAAELAPKSLAIRRPERIGLWSALPLYGFYWTMYPAIWLLNKSANLVLRATGLAGKGGKSGHDSHYSVDELKLILRTSQPGEKFNQDERNILAHSLDFSALSVSDLMRPINEVIALHAARPLADNLATVLRNRFSRYPYFDRDDTTVLGMVHLKDLFFAQQSGKALTSLAPYLRPVETISARTPALELFRRLRDGAPHFALIGEKGKRPLGFITLDNLLGAMVGEIHDEFSLNENDWLKQADGTLIGKASLPIFSLERTLGIDIENEELGLQGIESVGGLLMLKLGDVPKQGQRVSFNCFDIVAKKMNGPRILLVKVIPKLPAQAEHDEQD